MTYSAFRRRASSIAHNLRSQLDKEYFDWIKKAAGALEL